MILLDTGPLVALCNPHDGLNETARLELGRLERESFVLCSPVLTEACFLLPHRSQRERLRRFLREFSVAAYRSEDDLHLWSEVFDWLIRYHEHAPDWADGYLVIVAGKLKGARLWTYDGEFRTTWRRVDGSRVPLAVS